MATLVKSLADSIVDKIKDNFAQAHLSGNLSDTIYVEKVGHDEYKIHIPAQVYDQMEWIKNKVIVYQYEKGSYAEQVNKEGGIVNGKHTGNHIGYVEESISKGIASWEEKNNIKIGVQWK